MLSNSTQLVLRRCTRHIQPPNASFTCFRNSIWSLAKRMPWNTSKTTYPVAQKIPFQRILRLPDKELELVDDYAWMQQSNSKELQKHLDKEKSYVWISFIV